MYSSQLKTWKELLERLQETETELTRQLSIVTGWSDSQGTRWSSVGQVPGTPCSLIEILLQGINSAKTLNAMRLTASTPLPQVFIDRVAQAVDKLATAATALKGPLDLIVADSRPLKLATAGDIQLVENGAALFNIAPQAGPVLAAADGLVTAVGLIAPIAAQKGSGRGAAEKQVAEDQLTATSAALASAELASREAGQRRDAVTAAQAETARMSGELIALLAAAKETAESDLTKLSSAADQIGAANEKATTNEALIVSKLDAVTKTEAKANEAHDRLIAYVETLSRTEQRVNDAQAGAAKVVSDMEAERQQVEGLIARAEQMVKGATVAGLATAFAAERADLDKKLAWAFFWFVAGVLMLIGASAVFFAYVANVHFETGKLVIAANPAVNIPGLLSRTIILLGPIWFTQFSASRYNQLFDLRQQYSHKYNMAFSVEGFKKEAEKYQEDIAFWVFKTIAANPAQRPKRARRMDDLPTGLTLGAGEEARGNWVERLARSLPVGRT